MIAAATASAAAATAAPAAASAAVLFDMDGVIILSNQAHLAAWQAFARERLGLEITAEMFYGAISGRKNEEALAELFPGRFTPEQIQRISAEKEAFYRERFGPQLKPVPGILELIAELRALRTSDGMPPVRLALATSGPPENAEFTIRKFNLEDAFDAVVTGKDVTRAKPDPTIYLKAAELVGVEPYRCVVLEDAAAGVTAAKRAGMRCLAVATSEPPERLLAAGADEVRPDFTSVNWNMLKQLLGLAGKAEKAEVETAEGCGCG
ncbi:MAG: HAD family phosphatase [Limnochordales bacterium]|nr:HAD family phosphatase [Limnochordales bacterium]